MLAEAPLYIAQEQGFFDEGNLDVKIELIASPPAGFAAVQGGQMDLSIAPPVVFLTALEQSIPLKIVSSTAGYPEGFSMGSTEFDAYDDTAVYINPESGIKSLADLEGKTVSVPARKAMMEVTLVQALSDIGVDPGSINGVVLDMTSAAEALRTGKIDAASLVSPFTLKAEEVGMVALAHTASALFGRE